MTFWVRIANAAISQARRRLRVGVSAPPIRRAAGRGDGSAATRSALPAGGPVIHGEGQAPEALTGRARRWRSPERDDVLRAHGHAARRVWSPRAAVSAPLIRGALDKGAARVWRRTLRFRAGGSVIPGEGQAPAALAGRGTALPLAMTFGLRMANAAMRRAPSAAPVGAHWQAAAPHRSCFDPRARS